MLMRIASLIGIVSFASLCHGGEQSPDYPLQPVVDVHVGGELGRRIDMAIHKNFMAIDIDGEFLSPFRNPRPRVSVKGYDRFIGLGMLLDAAVKLAEMSKDPEVLARKDYLVAETIKTQQPSGWIGVFVEEPGAEQLWWPFAFHEAAYITFGLSENHRVFGDPSSLEAARKLGDYLIENWPNRPARMSFVTVGMVEACFSLYETTGDDKYLRFAADEPLGQTYYIPKAPLKSWEQEIHPPRRVSKENRAAEIAAPPRGMEVLHMYSAFERAIAQLRLDQIEPVAKPTLMSERLIEGMTRQEKPGMLVTGVTSFHEAWHEDQQGIDGTAETCATVYELWFLDELLRRQGVLKYGDIMERAILNSLFGAQQPTGRRTCYFTPFSGPRQYVPFDHYCCPNNFRRGMSSLPKLIYYQAENGIAVNLFATSEASMQLPGDVTVMVRQQTDYPKSGRVEFTIAPSRVAEFALSLRIPRWATFASIRINDGPAENVPPGERSHTISRSWQSGDRVLLEIPMPTRFVRGKEIQSGRAALLRGPVVYSINPARSGGLDGLTLRDITVDTTSIGEVVDDSSVHPGGTAFVAQGWSPSRELDLAPDLKLVLTEFLDPDGQEVYFRLSDPDAAVEDELYWTRGTEHR